jgi:hypothetical protein
VQEGIKNPPPPSGNEPEQTGDLEDDIIEEVRAMFVSDALEEV